MNTTLSSENFLDSLQLPQNNEAFRTSAVARFNELGFPTSRHEDWRYTSLTSIIEGQFQLPTGKKSQLPLPEIKGSQTIVIVNGVLNAEVSTALENEKLQIKVGTEASQSSFETSQEAEIFAALNKATYSQNIEIEVAANKIIDEPIHIIIANDEEGLLSSPRVQLKAAANAQLLVVEHYLGSGSYLNNSLIELELETGAKVDWVHLQNESSRAQHIHQLYSKVAKGALLQQHNINLGAALSRNNIFTELADENSEANLYGVTKLSGTQHCDNQSFINHGIPHCSSDEIYHHILDDHAQAVFTGKVFVAKDAQKTDAGQLNKTLLLSDDANIFSRPQLEIYADDVKCAHGATIGRLDPDAYFYLRSRGLAEETARRLLVKSFAIALIEKVPNKDVFNYIIELIENH